MEPPYTKPVKNTACLAVIPGTFIVCGEDDGDGNRHYCSQECLEAARKPAVKERPTS